MEENKIRKVFLDDLPNKQWNGTICCDWIKSIGYKVKFIYDDIEGFIEIIDYTKGRLKIKYKNSIYNMLPTHLVNCKLGNVLNKKTSKFKIEIGQVFKDKKRDLEIIDREYRKRKDLQGKDKWYKYHCNKCGAELWMIESSLLRGSNCACCTNQIIIKGINDIATTNPELVKYLVDIEDAYVNSIGSHKKVLMKCPDCGTEKIMVLNKLYSRKFSCPKCSDGISYPEKIIINLLLQLNIGYIKEYSKSNCNWIKNGYRYDFYFEKDNEEFIIETHGSQHYEKGFGRIKTDRKIKTLQEEQENDKIKYELAINNGIKSENYIIIDCRYSDLDFIKENILHSRLNEVFNLDKIDWIKIEENSQKSLVKEVCDYWHLHNEINNEELSIKGLTNIFNLSETPIREYLKRGTKLGMCNYRAKEEFKKSRIKAGKATGKSVNLFKDGVSLGIYPSTYELERRSEKLFGVKLLSSGISAVCLNKISQYKGFTFKYI